MDSLNLDIIKSVLQNGGAFALLTFIIVAFVWRLAPAYIADFRAALKDQRDDFRAELAAEREAREKWMAQVDTTLVKLSDRIDTISRR